jgi:2-C-methyl-D-erythritol 4-phosphate cytidylyltransferase
VVAGGSGRRFGGPKQFLTLAGRPVAAWSVAAARSVAAGVVLVVPEQVVDGAPEPGSTGEDALGADRVVAGGATRAASVRAGLAAVPALFAAVVDAVRRGDGLGAVPVVAVSDTLKRTAAGRVVATVDRDGVVATQTPQAFAADALREAHRSGAESTDDAALLEAAGLAVAAVEGDPGNLKLTRSEDLDVAVALLAGVDR